MLRIECTCGKFLKVGDALLGKKIKCPACGEIQLVKKPAAAMAAKPKSSPDIDEAVSPAPKKKTPVGNGVAKGPAPAKRHMREDHEDEDDLPRKKPAKKKSGNNMLLLLVGGGVAALLLLVGVAVGGYFIFFHKSTPEPIAKKTVDGPKAPAGKTDPVAIKLFVPFKPGDKRQVKVVIEIKSEIQNLASLPKDKQQAFDDANENEKVTIQGVLETRKVNSMGEETEVEFRIDRLDVIQLGAAKKNMPPTPKGTVVIGDLTTAPFKWSGPGGADPNVSAKYLDFVVDSFLKAGSKGDAWFGPSDSQLEGGSWDVNKDLIVKYLQSNDVMLGRPSTRNSDCEASGNAKFVKIISDGEKDYLDVDVNVKVKQKTEKGTISARNTLSFRLPRDGATGPVKKVEKIEDLKMAIQIPMPAEPGEPLKNYTLIVGFKTSITTETKYLGNFHVNNSSGNPVDSPKTSDILKAELRDAAAEWVPNQSKVKYSVNYKALENSKPIDRADYTLYMQFDDGEGGKKLIPVDEPMGGSLLGVQSKYSHPALPVTLPAKGNPAVCYLVLMEKVPGNVKEKEICSVRVPITGTPPSTAPTPEKLDIKLSNAKIQHDAKKKLSFSVDYKVAAGKFDPNKMYRIYVLLDGDKVKKGAVNVYEVLGKQLQSQDTITKDFTAEASANAKFTMWVVELPPGAKTGDSVSNIIAGSVAGGSPAPPGPAPYFQVNIVAAQKVKNPANPKLPAQQFTLQFNWTLTKGELNKQAAYTVYIVPAGGVKTPLGPPTTGATFLATSSYASTLPLLKVNSFQIHIEEQVQGQQSRVVSNNPSHNIK
ncbi:MAG TPA: hypothetical protein VE988_28860 [Gemmataceae bacterium]|nr:hypothetical protein [Gemmataceae bacterium]